MKYLRPSVFVCGLLLSGLFARAATWPAASGSLVDISNAIASASLGDTVTVPAGTTVWTNSMVIVKGIRLVGAGRGSTIIKDGIMEYGNWLLNWSAPANSTCMLTGFEFTTNATFYGQAPGGVQTNQSGRFRLSSTDDSRRFRVCSNHFNQLSGPAFWFYTVLGVVDHNWITGAPFGVPAFLAEVEAPSWGYAADTVAWGDGAYASGDGFGTTKSLFFEDNLITNLYAPSALTMLDAHAGARYVYRYNYAYGGSLEGHGAEAARTRSFHTIEVYTNIFAGNGVRSTVGYWRGGRGAVWSNSISGWTASAVFNLLDNRSIDNLDYPFSGADGRNPWDINNAGNPHVTGTCSSAGTLTMTDSGKSWTNDFWKGFTLRHTSGKTVSALSRSGDTATATATSHGFSSGNYVTIFGANEYGYNGLFNITVTDADHFTYSLQSLATPSSPATGTIKVIAKNGFGLITANTGTQLTFADSIYGSPVQCTFTAGDTYEINKVDQSFDQCGVTGGSDLGGVNYPTKPAGWNDQTVSPWYEWNNTREGGANVDFSTQFAGGGDYKVIVSGTHYNNDTQKPGYTPYQYPHPLVNGIDLGSDPGVTGTGARPGNRGKGHQKR